MTEPGKPEQRLDEDPNFLQFIREQAGEPVVAGGTLPEGHEGAYAPSDRELVEGAREAAQEMLNLAQARAQLSEERAQRMFGEAAGTS
jgi:hypothetical protein